MKSINVTDLKANLSRYLRMASKGVRIVVKDRDDPIAQLGPPDAEARGWREQLSTEGRLKLGSQDWSRLKIKPSAAGAAVQAALAAVREEPNEVRRR